MSAARLAWVAALAGALGCSPAVSGARPSASAPADEDSEAARSGFHAAEKDVIVGLCAVDRRLAQRMRRTPTEKDLGAIGMRVILAEDVGAEIVDGAIDPFSFDARRAALDELLARARAAPTTKSTRLDHELLVRLVEAERHRVDEERNLPFSASALVDAMVKTWVPPQRAGDLARKDALLARRLSQIEASVREKTLPEPRRTELDDALDGVEAIVGTAPFVASAAALSRLRDALGESHPRGSTSWDELRAGAAHHLGVTLPQPEVLDARFARAEAELRVAIRARASKLADTDERALERKAGTLLLGDGACRFDVPAEAVGVRSVGPPPERLAGCHLVRQVMAARSPEDELLALYIIHDHLALARWAIGGVASPDRSPHPWAGSVPMEREERLSRAARSRPVAALGAGLMAELLWAAGPAGVRGVAQAWSEFGDAPLDVVEREIVTSANAVPRPRNR